MTTQRPKLDLLLVVLIVATVAALAAVMPRGTPVDRSPPTYAPTPDYALNQLAEWYRALRDPIWAIPGVWSEGLRPERNQIEYSVDDESVVRALERVLDDFGVPRDAVLIRIGEPPELREG